MTGVIGVNGTNNDVPFGEELLARHPRLDVHELSRSGALVEGIETELRMPDGGCLRATLRAGKFHLGDQAIQISSEDRPYPLQSERVFVCPLCSTDRYRLYFVKGVWACRACQKRCHGVDYASRHAQRTIPGWHRLRRLRKRLGADPRPLWRLARKIRALEAKLIAHGHRIAGVLEDYYDR